MGRGAEGAREKISNRLHGQHGASLWGSILQPCDHDHDLRLNQQLDTQLTELPQASLDCALLKSKDCHGVPGSSVG